MSLKDLLLDDSKSIADVTAYLDALGHEHRLEEVLGCGGKHQAAMYDKAAAAPPITLEHFVPADVPSLTEVIHHGRNTLPAFKLFQKRFCRPADRAGELYGYNEGSTRPLIGPGYFVAHSTEGNDVWHPRGPIVVNYFRVPEGEVCEGWPEVVPNSSGLQMFVYNKTRDFMRKVSEHVSIGAAYKKEKSMGTYFVLVREDASAS